MCRKASTVGLAGPIKKYYLEMLKISMYIYSVLDM
jgi:hypothetical protein